MRGPRTLRVRLRGPEKDARSSSKPTYYFEVVSQSSPWLVKTSWHYVQVKKERENPKAIALYGDPFHRIVKGFVAQGGDISTGTGAGGESIYGKNFKDDKLGLKKKIDKRGLLCMCNMGKIPIHRNFSSPSTNCLS